MPDITTVWKVVWEKLLSNQLLDKIIKKTGKSLNNTYILYTGKKTKSGFQRIQYCHIKAILKKNFQIFGENFPKCDHQYSKTMKNPHRMQ
jgi:hypothetical protein